MTMRMRRVTPPTEFAATPSGAQWAMSLQPQKANSSAVVMRSSSALVSKYQPEQSTSAGAGGKHDEGEGEKVPCAGCGQAPPASNSSRAQFSAVEHASRKILAHHTACSHPHGPSHPHEVRDDGPCAGVHNGHRDLSDRRCERMHPAGVELVVSVFVPHAANRSCRNK